MVVSAPFYILYSSLIPLAVRQSVSSDLGSRRNGMMPMKVMPLRSVQGFS